MPRDARALVIKRLSHIQCELIAIARSGRAQILIKRSDNSGAVRHYVVTACSPYRDAARLLSCVDVVEVGYGRDFIVHADERDRTAQTFSINPSSDAQALTVINGIEGDCEIIV